MDSEQLNSLLTIIKNQGEEIELKDKEITKLENKLKKFEPETTKENKAVKKTKTPSKPVVSKTAKSKATK
jgi:alpha-amylase